MHECPHQRQTYRCVQEGSECRRPLRTVCPQMPCRRRCYRCRWWPRPCSLDRRWWYRSCLHAVLFLAHLLTTCIFSCFPKGTYERKSNTDPDCRVLVGDSTSDDASNPECYKHTVNNFRLIHSTQKHGGHGQNMFKSWAPSWHLDTCTDGLGRGWFLQDSSTVKLPILSTYRHGDCGGDISPGSAIPEAYPSGAPYGTFFILVSSCPIHPFVFWFFVVLS